MSKLIQHLIDNHKAQSNRPLRAGRNPDLAAEAMALYKAAADQMRAQRRGFMQSRKNTDQHIAEALAIRLTADLAKIDLLDARKYGLIQAALKAWGPAGVSENQRQCTLVRKALLELLPLARKKQELAAQCKVYKAHLSKEIAAGVASEHPEPGQKEKILKTIQKAGVLRSPVSEAETPKWEQRIQQQAQHMPISEEGVSKAVEKYCLVSAMQRTLNSEKPASVQISDFRQALQKSKPVLEKNRDSAGMVFLKAVLTVLSVGLAIPLGLWNVKGDRTAHDLQQTLDTRETPRASAALG